MGYSRRIVSYLRARPFVAASRHESRLSHWYRRLALNQHLSTDAFASCHGTRVQAGGSERALRPQSLPFLLRDARVLTTIATGSSGNCSNRPCIQPAHPQQFPPIRGVTTQSGPQQATAAVASVGGAVFEMPPNPQDYIEAFVDGHPVQIPKGATVFQACEAAGVDIPRFCYHPRLSIAGNCRMCLVEVEKTPKPVASCAMPAMPGMKIKTDTPLVLKAREGVMEFLLANHPLDCPICDQGGECDLQDQSMEFGSDRGRFIETKRTVLDKNLGPLVKTVMTRCIQCTRCVRFASEIAGIQDLGVLGRGGSEEIGTYVEMAMTSELSGNVIDICPVGALTSKPYAFTARSWELKTTESIDVSDALGSNIKIDSRGPEVMRISPRLNEDINEEWLSDKARFCYDGLKRQRLNEPMLRSMNGRLEPASWYHALHAVAEAVKKVKPEEIAGIAGKLSDAEAMIALKDFLNKLGCENILCEGDGSEHDADIRGDYLLNSTIAGLEKADVCLLIGTQLRNEAPLVNTRLRKAVRSGRAKVATIGPPVDLTYNHTHLGSGTETLVQVAEGRHPFCAVLAKAKYPAVIVGAGIFERRDKETVMAAVQTIVAHARVVKDDWNGFNVLLLNAGHAGGLDLGLVPGVGTYADWKKSVKFLYVLGADDIPLDDIPEDAFVVYQGHHGDRSVYRANAILPGAAYSEKEGTYSNTEGRIQQTSPAVPTIGDARDDWKILRAVSEVAGANLPYDNLSGLRARMQAVSPNLFRVDELEPSSIRSQQAKSAIHGGLEISPFRSTVENFYMTNSICRASKIMAQCTAAFTGTKG